MVALTTTVVLMHAYLALGFSVRLGAASNSTRDPHRPGITNPQEPPANLLLISTCVYEDGAVVRAQVVCLLYMTLPLCAFVL